MPVKTKHVIFAGLAIVGVSFIAASVKASNTGNRLEVSMQTRIKPSLSITTVWVDATLVNPTKGSLLVSDPLVVLSRNNQTIKTINLSGHRLNIQPNSTTKLSDPVANGGIGGVIRIDLATADLITMFPDVLAAILGTGPSFVIRVDTTLKVKAPNLPAFIQRIPEQITVQSPF